MDISQSSNYFPSNLNHENLEDIYNNCNNTGDSNQGENTWNTIKNVPISTMTVHTSEVTELNKLLKTDDFTYPNPNKDDEREIPELKIKNEDYFEDDIKIDGFLKNIREVDESQFKICRKCKKNNNEYFCKRCQKNICSICANNCREKKEKEGINHELIDLIQMKKKVNKAREDISKTILKLYKEKEKTESKEKSQKIYQLKNEDIMINKSEINENIERFSLPNDISFIARINFKEYTNYFHYKNILYNNLYIAEKFLKIVHKNYLKIIYEVEENNKEKAIQIFGENFVEENKNKFTLVINNEPKEELVDKVTIDDDYLEVILVQKSDTEEEYEINNLSYMFCDCIKLLKIEEISQRIKHGSIDFENVRDISHMFEGCEKIESLDFLIFNGLNKINQMEYLFYNCRKLKDINGLEKLDTSNVNSMSNLFYGCLQLNTLNRINRFNTRNVTNFSEMFGECENLENLPYINEWNMERAVNLEKMFKNCKKLKKISEISGWNLKNVNNLKEMFFGCGLLEELPADLKLNYNRIRSLDKMFFYCPALRQDPNNAAWQKLNELSRKFKTDLINH